MMMISGSMLELFQSFVYCKIGKGEGRPMNFVMSLGNEVLEIHPGTALREGCAYLLSLAASHSPTLFGVRYPLESGTHSGQLGRVGWKYGVGKESELRYTGINTVSNHSAIHFPCYKITNP